jgi:hypothetical protein
MGFRSHQGEVPPAVDELDRDGQRHCACTRCTDDASETGHRAASAAPRTRSSALARIVAAAPPAVRDAAKASGPEVERPVHVMRRERRAVLGGGHGRGTSGGLRLRKAYDFGKLTDHRVQALQRGGHPRASPTRGCHESDPSAGPCYGEALAKCNGPTARARLSACHGSAAGRERCRREFRDHWLWSPSLDDGESSGITDERSQHHAGQERDQAGAARQA